MLRYCPHPIVIWLMNTKAIIMPLRSGRPSASNAPKSTVITTEPVRVHFHRRSRLPNNTRSIPPTTSPIFGGRERAMPVVMSVAPPQNTLLEKSVFHWFVHHCAGGHLHHRWPYNVDDIIEHGLSLNNVRSGICQAAQEPTNTTKKGAVISLPFPLVKTFRGHSG